MTTQYLVMASGAPHTPAEREQNAQAGGKACLHQSSWLKGKAAHGGAACRLQDVNFVILVSVSQNHRNDFPLTVDSCQREVVHPMGSLQLCGGNVACYVQHRDFFNALC